MNGFSVYQENEAIKRTENKAGSFSLLMDDGEFEIVQVNVRAERSIICQPTESHNATSVVFVQSGELYHTNENQYIGAGQRYEFRNLERTHHLCVKEDAQLLMFRKKRLFESQVKRIDQTYELISLIHEKDHYTGLHCNTTGNLAVQIAIRMNLSEKTIHDVLYAGKVHDVGKIDIPEHILNKPGWLTDLEYARIQTHSEAGYEIVMRDLENEEIAKIVLEHHERLDGSGYPNALKGDQICMGARIIAVVDSFDAMYSNRPYRKAMPLDKVLAELVKYKGIWYDPEVVECFIRMIEEEYQGLS